MGKCLLLLVCVLSADVFGQSPAGSRRAAIVQESDSDRETVRFVLAGDSTVTDQAGWGRGFTDLLTQRAECVNLARGGRSSRSYRTEGWWRKCLEQSPDFLLIQFGHNDQPGKGEARESAADGDFREHLGQYVDEARAAGIRPVLITSLTRRRWNSDGHIQPTLAAYAEATRIVARQKDVPLLDLNRLSIEQCNSIGSEAFRAYEPMTEKGADHTHLNAEGSAAVGRIVAQALLTLLPELTPCIQVEQLNPAQDMIDEAAAHGIRLHETDAVITIRHQQRTVLVYNKKSPPVPDGIDPVYQRSGFLHPVTSPQGKTVTATFPFDHPHQHGVFSAWVRTTYNERPLDFWNLAGGSGRVLHQRVVSRFSNDEATGFEVDLIHRAVQSPVVDVLRERWKISVRPTDGTYHCFDLESLQQALTDKPLIVQKHHYGGFALRGPVRWLLTKDADTGTNTQTEPNRFLNDSGADRKKGNLQPARWVSLSGQIDAEPTSITVLCHAENYRAPQTARLHPTKPYFCFAPCINDEFRIDKAHPLKSRYRFLITDAVPDSEWLHQQWHTWCGDSEE